jgi:hypothetical protein
MGELGLAAVSFAGFSVTNGGDDTREPERGCRSIHDYLHLLGDIDLQVDSRTVSLRLLVHRR